MVMRPFSLEHRCLWLSGAGSPLQEPMRQFLVASGACVLPSGKHAGESHQASSRPSSSSAGSPVSELQTRPSAGVPLDSFVVLTDVFCVPPLDWSVLLGAFFEELYAWVDALRRALPAHVRQKSLGRVLLIGPGLNSGIDPMPASLSGPLPSGLEARDSPQYSTRDSVCLELFRSGLARMARTLGQICAREGLTVNLIDPRGSLQDPGFHESPSSLTQPPKFETIARGVSRVGSSVGGDLAGPEPSPASGYLPGYPECPAYPASPPADESGSDGRAAALLAKNRRVARALGIRDILELTGYLLSPWSSSVTGAVFQPTQSGLVALAA